MPHDGLVRVGAVPRCIGVGEAGEGVAVACLDGVQPCLLHWKAQTSMIETHKSRYAGKVEAAGIKGCRRG